MSVGILYINTYTISTVNRAKKGCALLKGRQIYFFLSVGVDLISVYRVFLLPTNYYVNYYSYTYTFSYSVFGAAAP